MSLPLSQPKDFPRMLATQGRVLGTLIIRELQVRYGRENVGFLWVICEPLMLATVISTMHTFMGGGHGGDMHPGVFTLLGYCTFIIFRGIFNRAEGMLEGNVTLLFHRMITPFDILFSRTLMELAACFSAFAILLPIFIAIGYGHLPVRPLYLFSGFILITWWSFAWALLITNYTFGSRTLGRLVHPISYFMIPLSGAFWTVSMLAEPWRSYAVYNPMVCIFEIARYGQFSSASDQHLYPNYVIAWNAVLTYIGLLGLRRISHKIHLS